MFVHMASSVAVLCGKSFNTGRYVQIILTNFQTCHAYRHRYLLPLYTTFSDLDLGWRSRDQPKTKPVGFIFSHTFQLIRLKFDVLDINSQHLPVCLVHLELSVPVWMA